MAAALTAERQQARTLADTLRSALGSAPVRVLADALAMTNASLPGALMEAWAHNNGMHGVCHEPTGRH